MRYGVVNGDVKKVAYFESEKEAAFYCNLALKFSRSLDVFYYNERELENIDLTGYEIMQ